MNDAVRIVDKLFSVGERLSDGLRRQIIDLGTAAEPRLLELIGDDRLFEREARGRGWTPLHAIEILGALGSTAAIPRLLELLEVCECDEYAYNKASYALEAIGGPALEPCLAAYAATDDEEFRRSLGCVLAGLKVRDERIYEILVDEFEEDLMLGASNFAEYGDARALELLAKALDEYEIVDDVEDGLVNHEVIDICDALVELTGELTQRQQAKLARVKAIHQRWLEQQDAGLDPIDEARDELPGRNDPCHCGSGKKYKKCHLAADDNAARD